MRASIIWIFAGLFDTIHAEDVQEMFRRWAQPKPLDHVGGRAEVTIERRKIMEHAISFPALGLDFNINRVAVNLFGKDIYWYGIIICLGFCAGGAVSIGGRRSSALRRTI